MTGSTYSVASSEHYGYSKATRRWATVTLPESGFGEWSRDYHELEIAVLDVFDNPYTFSPRQYPELNHWVGSLTEWFLAQSGRLLSTLTVGLPTLAKRTALVQPLHYYPVDTVACPPNTHPSQDFSIDDADDLVIGFEGEQLDEASKQCLFSVGGLWVPHVREPYGIRLRGAGSIVRRGSVTNGTVLNFNGIGNVTTHLLSDLTISKVDTESTYHSTLTITSPETLYSKSILLFVAGKLHLIPSSSIISDNVFSISTNNWNIAEHIISTNDRIDWSELGLEDPINGVSVNRLLSDATFESYLKHPLSFIAIVDNPYLEFDYGAVDACRRTGVYTYVTASEPSLLINHVGDVIDYWPTHELDLWVLYTNYAQHPNYAMYGGKYKKQTTATSVSDHLSPNRVPNLRMLSISARVD